MTQLSICPAQADAKYNAKNFNTASLTRHLRINHATEYSEYQKLTDSAILDSNADSKHLLY